MLKSAIWLFILLVGFGLMFFSYWNYGRIAEPTPWTEAFMYVGKGEAGPEAQLFACTRARIVLLPPSEVTRAFLDGFEGANPGAGGALRRALREKAVFYPEFRRDFTPAALGSGRLPAPGMDEVLAGCDAAHRDSVSILGRAFNVVGVLGRSATVFADAYIIPGDSAPAGLFGADAGEVQDAYIFAMSRRELRSAVTAEALAAAFSKRGFVLVAPDARIGAAPYYLYLLGLALLLLGGTGLFFRLFVFLACIFRGRVLGPPLAAISQWPRLFWAMHLTAFGGLVVVGALAYLVPPLQTSGLHMIQQSTREPYSPLGVAAKAYASGSMPWAAAVTLAVNFFLGSLAVITVPSVIVPGAGAAMLALRSAVIGLLLAPSTVTLAGMMLPHSFTILVEMEAYIVAAFFALMIPIYIFRKQEGPTVLRRYGRALLLNLKGNLIVFIILAVAAAYEAVEVILQMQMR